jgi:hypothetical protein
MPGTISLKEFLSLTSVNFKAGGTTDALFFTEDGVGAEEQVAIIVCGRVKQAYYLQLKAAVL